MPLSVKSRSQEPQYLPEDLRKLVRWSVATLGEVIAEEEGSKFFEEIESLRSYLKNFRHLAVRRQQNLLQKIHQSFARKNSDELNKIAHAFALMLELINNCENAHRSHRIETDLQVREMPFVLHDQNIFWVLTAHPTEARNPIILEIFENIFLTLREALRGSLAMEHGKLKAYLKIAWKTSLARTEKPSPIDEGNTLFTVLLRENIVETFLKLREIGYKFTFRTWVGGDKDGHPFVDEKVLLQSLTLSRQLLLDFILKYLKPSQIQKAQVKSLSDIRKIILKLRKISSSDIQHVEKLKQKLQTIEGVPQAKLLLQLFAIFPHLLIPLELREDASVINNCFAEKTLERKKTYAIYRMLLTLKTLSGKQPITLYARGLIISMVAHAKDLENAYQLVHEVFGKPALKIVPLFENKAALISSAKIIEEFLKNPQRLKVIQKFWDNKLEVMVGYSDSSKEIGVFKSRLLIRESVQKLVPLIKKHKMIPILFHGSGGSITRGGGSFREQSSWWPKEAFTHYKATIQGEMVQRTFASSPILMQNLAHIIEEQNKHAETNVNYKLSSAQKIIFDQFSTRASAEYQMLVSDPQFLKFVEKTTLYSYLKSLALGSRPSKRAQLNAVTDLRAIPWVLTWTQSRLLLPTWWGIGKAFEEMSTKEKLVLKKIFAKDPLCLSFLKQVGFSLAKVEEGIFVHYIQNARGLSEQEKQFWIKKISKEFHLSIKAVQYFSGEKDLTWFRKWMGESVRYRSPLIHPLNIAQILAIHRNNHFLIRETTTGIACGMMTTG